MSAFESSLNLLDNVQKLSLIEKERGASIGDIEFKEQENEGVGIYATEDMTKNTVLMSLPLKSCLTVDAIISYPKICKVFEENPGILSYPDEVLAIGLMYAKLNSSDEICPWLAHVHTLPTKFNTTLYWEDEELEELRNCTVYHLTGMMKRQISADYDAIHKPLSEAYPSIFGSSTIDFYVWALSNVYSRCIELSKNKKAVRCIPPLIDMANHNPFVVNNPLDSFHYDEATDTVQLICAKDMKKGEECYALYGFYCNAKLVYTYGFVVLKNPHKAIDLYINLQPSSNNFELKQKILSSHEITRSQDYNFHGTIRPNFVSSSLLATIRIIQATSEELSNFNNAFSGKMLSVRNEIATYVSLRNLITARMKVESAAGDRVKLGDMLLSSENIPSSNRLMCALIVRVEERELLQEVLSLVNSWLQQLEALGEGYSPPDASS